MPRSIPDADLAFWQPPEGSESTATLSTPEIFLESLLTCPNCGRSNLEKMPIDVCLYFYECPDCHSMLKPLAGDCCVFCSYGSVKCPPGRRYASSTPGHGDPQRFNGAVTRSRTRRSRKSILRGGRRGRAESCHERADAGLRRRVCRRRRGDCWSKRRHCDKGDGGVADAQAGFPLWSICQRPAMTVSGDCTLRHGGADRPIRHPNREHRAQSLATSEQVKHRVVTRPRDRVVALG